MKRVKNFGDLSVDKQLDLLEDGLEKNDILLFQFYGMIDEYTASQEIIDEYFENYCDDVIYYYNPQIQKEIQQDILDVFIKNRAIYVEFVKISEILFNFILSINMFILTVYNIGYKNRFCHFEIF